MASSTRSEPESPPDYVARAMEKIERDGTPAIKVRGMDADQIRELCDVPTDGSPNPPGFSPRKLRNTLIELIPVVRRQQAQERRRARLEELIRREPGEEKTTVTFDDEGRFVLTEPEVF